MGIKGLIPQMYSRLKNVSYFGPSFRLKGGGFMSANKNIGTPANVILRASDQHRKWKPRAFHSFMYMRMYVHNCYRMRTYYNVLNKKAVLDQFKCISFSIDTH